MEQKHFYWCVKNMDRNIHMQFCAILSTAVIDKQFNICFFTLEVADNIFSPTRHRL